MFGIVFVILGCSDASEETGSDSPTSPQNSTANVPDGNVGSITRITVYARNASGIQRTSGGDNVQISITGSNTVSLDMNNIEDLNNGSYTASYNPTNQGADQIVISINNIPIQGSPFTSNIGLAAGLLIQPANIDLGENGGSAVVNYSLSAQPSDNVTINTHDYNVTPARFSVSTNQLEFTPGNWSTPQPVTFTGIDDDIINNGIAVLVRPSIDPQTLANEYLNIVQANLPELSVNIINDDFPPLLAPSVQSTEAGNGQITVNWNAVVNASGYYIYYANNNNVNNNSTRIDAGNNTNFTVPNLTNRTMYYFRVAAYDGNTTSGPLSANTLSDFPYAPFSAEWNRPNPTGYSYNQVRWLSNQFIAVGEQGTILTSPDGNNWTRRISGLSGIGARLTGVAFSGNRFMAAGWNNSLTLSNNASPNNWSPVTVPPPNGGGSQHFDRIIWNGSQFVLLSSGQHRIFFVNEDGTNFQAFDTTTPTAAILQDIIWDAQNSRYLGCGGRVYSSINGITWTDLLEFQGTINCSRMKNINGNIVILGDSSMVTSDNWTEYNITGATYLSDISYTNGIYAAVQSDSMYTSNNRTDWIATSFTNLTNRIDTISARPAVNQFAGDFTLMGNFGQILKADAAVSPTLSDVAPLLGANDFTALASNGNILVALGRDSILYSPDNGNTWNTVDNNTLDAAIVTADFNDVKWLNGQFIAVGSAGLIATSSNGQTWNATVNGSNDFNAVAWNQDNNNPLYIAVGNGGSIYAASDPTAWNVETSNTNQSLWDVIWHNGQFKAVGNNRSFLLRGNAVWSAGIVTELPDTASIRDIVSNGITLLLRTENPSRTYYSTNGGTNWTQGESIYDKIIWDGNLFVSLNGSRFSFSPNGIKFNFQTLNETTTATDILFTNNRYFISSRYGHILQINP